MERPLAVKWRGSCVMQKGKLLAASGVTQSEAGELWLVRCAKVLV